MKIFDTNGTELGEGTIFAGKVLEYAMLSNHDLSGMDFAGANLYGANLCGAKLDKANFAGALLLGANLQGASAWGTNFAGADFGGDNEGNGTILDQMQWNQETNFASAFYDDNTVLPAGLVATEHEMRSVSNVVLSQKDCEALQSGDLSKLMELLGRG